MSDTMNTSPVLRYGFGNTAIGTAIVAVSGAGIASILIGDGPSKLLRELAGGCCQDNEAATFRSG